MTSTLAQTFGCNASLSLPQDTKFEIMLQLSFDDLQRLRINHDFNTLLNNRSFWCRWVEKHIHLKPSLNIDCYAIAREWVEDYTMDDNILMAFDSCDMNRIQFLFDHQKIDASEVWFTRAVSSHCYPAIELLLSTFVYPQELLDISLDFALFHFSNISIIYLLLQHGATNNAIRYKTIKKIEYSNNQQYIDLLNKL